MQNIKVYFRVNCAVPTEASSLPSELSCQSATSPSSFSSCPSAPSFWEKDDGSDEASGLKSKQVSNITQEAG